jgi:hypothetical protein
VPVFPVFPVVPVVPELEVAEEVPEDELPLLDVDDETLAPGRSWATTIPRAAVAPAAATIAPRVRVRRRDFALSLSAGVLGWTGADMWLLAFLGRGRPYPNMLESTPTQDPLCSCCDILPHRSGG